MSAFGTGGWANSPPIIFVIQENGRSDGRIPLRWPDFKLAFLRIALDIPVLYMDAKSTQSSGIFDILAWLDANWRKVVAGAVLVVLVVAAIAFYQWNQRQSEINANKALLSVSYANADGTLSASPDQLSKVAQEHPNTSAALRAQLLAAGAAFEKGDYSAAQTHFQAVASANGPVDLKAQAAYGLAAVAEAQKNLDQALQKYQEVSRQFANEPVAAQAKLAIGRIYEAQGKPEDALKIYNELEKQTQFDFWRGEASQRKEQIIRRHPNLKEQAAATGDSSSR